MTHRVVSGEEWLAARRELLAKEKEFTRLRDQLSALRRELPWEALTREYVFDCSHWADNFNVGIAQLKHRDCGGARGSPGVLQLRLAGSVR